MAALDRIVPEDYDNDGWLDLYLVEGDWTTIPTVNKLFRANGNGGFERVTTGAIATDVFKLSSSAAWGDYDKDGFLDLIVGLGFRHGDAIQSTTPNVLYRNDGDGSFTRVTTGSVVTDYGYTRQVLWVD